MFLSETACSSNDVELSNWNHLSVDVLGTSDIAFDEIWFVLLLHKHPAIVNLLFRECQNTFLVLPCTAHCPRIMYSSTPINNPNAHAISDTMTKDSSNKARKGDAQKSATNIDDRPSMPSTLDDFQPCPMNSCPFLHGVHETPIQWCSQWSSSSSAEILFSFLISNSLSIWCLILRASCVILRDPAIILTAPPSSWPSEQEEAEFICKTWHT